MTQRGAAESPSQGPLYRSADQMWRLTRFSRSSCWPERGFGSIEPSATRSAIDASDDPAPRISAPSPAPPRVARRAHRVEPARSSIISAATRSARASVSMPPTWRVEQVGPGAALAAELRVEVEAAGREAASRARSRTAAATGPRRNSGTGPCPSRSGSRRGSRRCCRRCHSPSRRPPRGGTSGQRASRGSPRC